jgi:hypothetical protein
MATTVYADPRFPGLFHTEHRPNAIPLTVPQLPINTIWGLLSTDHAFVETQGFYQRILGADPPLTSEVSVAITTYIELETLVSCSDGSFNPGSKHGSHGWIISNMDKTVLAQGTDPTDGPSPHVIILSSAGGTDCHPLCPLSHLPISTCYV